MSAESDALTGAVSNLVAVVPTVVAKIDALKAAQVPPPDTAVIVAATEAINAAVTALAAAAA